MSTQRKSEAYRPWNTSSEEEARLARLAQGLFHEARKIEVPADAARRVMSGIQEGAGIPGSWLYKGALSAALAASVVAAVFLLMERGERSAQFTASVIDIRGEAFSPSRRLSRGTTLTEALSISLRPGSELLIEIPGVGRIRFGKEARFRFGRGEGGVTVHLAQGRLTAHIIPRKGRGPFRVKTPKAQVLVVGTLFTVQVDLEGKTFVQVDRGAVRIDGPMGPFVVEAGRAWTSAGRAMQNSAWIDRGEREALELGRLVAVRKGRTGVKRPERGAGGALAAISENRNRSLTGTVLTDEQKNRDLERPVEKARVDAQRTKPVPVPVRKGRFKWRRPVLPDRRIVKPPAAEGEDSTANEKTPEAARVTAPAEGRALDKPPALQPKESLSPLSRRREMLARKGEEYMRQGGHKAALAIYLQLCRGKDSWAEIACYEVGRLKRNYPSQALKAWNAYLKRFSRGRFLQEVSLFRIEAQVQLGLNKAALKGVKAHLKTYQSGVHQAAILLLMADLLLRTTGACRQSLPIYRKLVGSRLNPLKIRLKAMERIRYCKKRSGKR